MALVNVRICDGTTLVYSGPAFIRKSKGKWSGILQPTTHQMLKAGSYTIHVLGQSAEVTIRARGGANPFVVAALQETDEINNLTSD